MYVLIFQNDNKPSKPDFCWFLLGHSCTLQYHYLNKNCILEIYFTICQSGLMHSLDSGLFLFCRGWWVKCLSINRLNWKLSKYSSVQCSHSLTHLVLVAVAEVEKRILAKLGVGSTAGFHRFPRNHLEHTPLWTYPTTYEDLADWAFSLTSFDSEHNGGCWTGHGAQVLWVSDWKLNSDSCLPSQNSKVSSASPCNCAAEELSCGLSIPLWVLLCSGFVWCMTLEIN